MPVRRVCNLYRFEPAQYAFDFKLHPSAGNLAPDYIGADSDGPVIRQTADGLELTRMRWGFPPVQPKRNGKWAAPITNIRNLESSWWRDVNRKWMQTPEHRCLVPFKRFAEPVPGKGRENAWFETTTAQSFFAGVWRPWSGETRLVAVEGKSRRQRSTTELDLFAFLTVEPNAIVAPIHPKAMPVILTEPDECEAWLAGGEESFRLQRPLADDLLERVDPDERGGIPDIG